MPERPAAGRSAVTRRAVTDIVRTTVLGSYGVVGFATPAPWDHLVRRLGLGEPGIRVTLGDRLEVELRLRVAYGLPIAEVARQVDSAVRYALGRDLGREPASVRIHVDGLVEQTGRVPMSGEVGAERPADVAAHGVGPDAGPEDRTPGPEPDVATDPPDVATDPGAVPSAESDDRR